MIWEDTKNFTWGELNTLTWDQIKLDKFELLKLAATGKIEFSDTVWYKLCLLYTSCLDIHMISAYLPAALAADVGSGFRLFFSFGLITLSLLPISLPFPGLQFIHKPINYRRCYRLLLHGRGWSFPLSDQVGPISGFDRVSLA